MHWLLSAESRSQSTRISGSHELLGPMPFSRPRPSAVWAVQSQCLWLRGGLMLAPVQGMIAGMARLRTPSGDEGDGEDEHAAHMTGRHACMQAKPHMQASAAAIPRKLYAQQLACIDCACPPSFEGIT